MRLSENINMNCIIGLTLVQMSSAAAERAFSHLKTYSTISRDHPSGTIFISVVTIHDLFGNRLAS